MLHKHSYASGKDLNGKQYYIFKYQDLKERVSA